MTRDEILRLLPHRPPMLLIDEVVSIDPGKQLVALRHVKADEPWFAGHFPGDPILPGVLVAESLAQAAALLFLSAHPERAGSAVYLAGMDRLRFRRPVRPGETLRLEITATAARSRVVTFDARATCEGARVAEGSFMAAVPA